VAAVSQAIPHGVEAILPLHDGFFAASTVLDEEVAAARFEHPAHLRKSGLHVREPAPWNGLASPTGRDAIERVGYTIGHTSQDSSPSARVSFERSFRPRQRPEASSDAETLGVLEAVAGRMGQHAGLIAVDEAVVHGGAERDRLADDDLAVDDGRLLANRSDE